MSDWCHAQNYAAMVLSSTVTLLFKAGFKPLCFAVTSYIAVTLVKMVLRLLMVFSLRSPVRKTETIQLCFLHIHDTFIEKWFSGKCRCSELHHTEVYGVKSLTGMNRTGQWKFLKLAFSGNLPNLLTQIPLSRPVHTCWMIREGLTFYFHWKICFSEMELYVNLCFGFFTSGVFIFIFSISKLMHLFI